MSSRSAVSGIAIDYIVNDHGSATIKTMSGNVKTLDQQLNSLTGTSAKLDAGLKAFSWTAFAGGALNVTTAMAQVYTSLSNLDRVQLQVRNSMVGIERAEDLLARKTMMLNREIEKNSSVSQKALQLRNEIATATDDLANKEEKLKLAQDQVNDTYILFGTNIINTVFGTVQTLVGLKTMLAVKSLGVSAAIDKETASIGANTGAALLNTKAMAGMVASKSAMGGMVPGLNAAANSGSILTRVMGGLGGMMGVTVVGAAAAAAVGIGAFVYEQIKANDSSTKLTEKLSELTKKYGETAIAAKSLADASNFSNPFTGSISQRIQELQEAKTELEKTFLEHEALMSKPSLFKSEADRIKEAKDAITTREKIKIDLDQATKDLAKFELDLKNTIDSIAINSVKGITVEQGKIFTEIKSDIISTAKMIDALTPATDDWSESLEISITHWNEALNLSSTQVNILTDIINKETKLNDIKASGNKAEEHSIKNQTDLWRQMAELKKKLIKGSELRSFMGGETGFFLDKEGPGFAGIFNRKTGKLTPSMIAIDAWDRVKFWEKEGLRLIEKEGRDPRYVALYIETKIDEIRHEPNFVSAISNFQASKLAQQVSSQMVKIQQEYKSVIANLKKDAPTPSFPGYSSITSPFSVGKIVKNPTTGLYERQGEGMGVQQISVRNLGTVLASQRGVNTSTMKSSQGLGPKKGSLTTSRSKGSKGRKPRNISPEEAMQNQLRGYMGDAENQYYLGLTGVSLGVNIKPGTGLGNPSRSNYYVPPTYLWDDFHVRFSDATARVKLGKEILALGVFDPDYNIGIYKNTSSELTSMLQREQAQITHQSALIGETTQDIIRLRNSPEPEFYDRIRYSERLEQISTGATVF